MIHSCGSSVCLQQIGTLDLAHPDEIVLGLHLLQFAEVIMLIMDIPVTISSFAGQSKCSQICLMYLLWIPLCFCLLRLLKRHAPIFCQMCCVNIYTIYQKTSLDFIPTVRYEVFNCSMIRILNNKSEQSHTIYPLMLVFISTTCMNLVI